MKRRRMILFAMCLTALAWTGCRIVTDQEKPAEEKTMLSVWLRSGYNLNQGIWKGSGSDRLEEELGITLSISVEDATRDRKIRQYLASGTLPDLIVFQGQDEAKLLMDAGLLQPLDEYEAIMPNIFENESYAQAIAASRLSLSNDTGSLLLLPVSVGRLEGQEYEYVPRLRWLAYSKIGCPTAETLEDYLDIVSEMKRNTLYTYTGQGMYGFSLSGEGDVYALHHISELGYLYGIDMQMVSPLMETGLAEMKTASIFRDDSFYKRALHFYFEANQRGLLDRNSRTQTEKSLREKFERGEVMFGMEEMITQEYGKTTRDSYVPAVAGDMSIYRADSLDYGNNIYFGVNSGSPHVEKICEFLNWMYDTDHLREMYNGPYDLVWTYDEDKIPYVSDEGWSYIQENGIGGEAVMNAAGFEGNLVLTDGHTLSCQYWESSQEMISDALNADIRKYLQADTVEEYLEEHAQVVGADPALYMLPPLPEEIREKMRQIGEDTCQISWDMIYAEDEEEFEALWEKLCRRAKAAGMDEIETYYREILIHLGE